MRMRTAIRRLLTLGLLGTLPLLLTGCFLRLLFGSVGVRDTAFGSVFVATIGGIWGPMAVCDFDESGGLAECTYTFLDLEAEEPITRTSSARLAAEFGVFGLFVDPLILQVPDFATNFAGSIDDGSGVRPLVITETSSLDVQPGTQLRAEGGQKLVILELPPDIVSTLVSSGTLNNPFSFNFEFELPTLADVDVKPMYTGKVTFDGDTFFVPMLPCVSDFADVPAVTLPVSSSAVNLIPQILAALQQNPDIGCDGMVYDFTGVGTPAPLQVVIDIQPGSDPNSINCRVGSGLLPVAILTTDSFDALSVDHTTVRFEGAAEAHVDPRSGIARRHEEDVDGDGRLDLVIHFDRRDLDLTCQSTEGVLVGQTFGGQDIEGSDAVRMIGG